MSCVSVDGVTGMQARDYGINIAGVEVSSSNKSNVTVNNINSGLVKYDNVKLQSKRGDINGDGSVDVTDVNIIVNIILGKDNASNYPGNANVDGQGGIDVSDVNVIVNIMLGKN